MDRIRQRIGERTFLEGLRRELRSGAYHPSPSRRKLIPKPSKRGNSGPWAYPRSRIASFRAWSKHSWSRSSRRSFGLSPTGFVRQKHGALEHIRQSLQPRKRDQDSRRHRMPYNWIIEGDIKGCFDNINHHLLMDRLRKRVADRRMMELIGQFLKAGVLAEDQFLRTDNGTPQGGIISPLLANIALSAVEERYERWTYRRLKTPGPPPQRWGSGGLRGHGVRIQGRTLCVLPDTLCRRFRGSSFWYRG